MLDLSNSFLPYASILAGLTGSLHCVGMCGGLVTASCHSGKDVLKYQLGRLLGYLILGTVAFVLGYALKGVVSFHWMPFASGIFIGSLFIYWGILSFRGEKAEVPLPSSLRKIYQHLYRNFVSPAESYRSFFIGLISILLPCGLLYGFLVAALALGGYEQAILSLVFFWIGTLPGMMAAPGLIRKLLGPLKKNLPKAYAVLFIAIGVATIAGRLSAMLTTTNPETNTVKETHHCH